MVRRIDSAIRHHFTQIPSDSKIPKVKCNYCSHMLAFTATRGHMHLDNCAEYQKLQPKMTESKSSIKRYTTTMTKIQQEANELLVARLIYCDGRPFNLFDTDDSSALFQSLSPAFELPSRKQLAGPLLDKVFSEYKAKVMDRLAGCDTLNVIFDASDNINDERVLNICVQIPHEVAFYWTTINTHAVELTAENHLLLLGPILAEITANNPQRINSFSTDSCNTMRALRHRIRATSDFEHCFWVLCDSHGLQLLIKDLLSLPDFASIVQQATNLISGFSSSKLQKARLYEEQERIYNRKYALAAG